MKNLGREFRRRQGERANIKYQSSDFGKSRTKCGGEEEGQEIISVQGSCFERRRVFAVFMEKEKARLDGCWKLLN
jgi:hypothetical protein